MTVNFVYPLYTVCFKRYGHAAKYESQSQGYITVGYHYLFNTLYNNSVKYK